MFLLFLRFLLRFLLLFLGFFVCFDKQNNTDDGRQEESQENNKITNLRLVSKEENTPHRLSFEIAEEIRRRYVDGETQTALGKEFGVSRQAIQHIICGRSYKHMPEKMHYRGRV